MVVRRGPFALAAAAAGFVGALGLHASGSATSMSTKLSAPAARPSTPSTTTSPPSTASPSSTTPASKSTTTTIKTPQSTIPNTSIRSATGSAYQYGYGQLAVKVTLTGKKITELTVVGLQTAESYSQQLASQVIPTLRQEVLAAQSIQVNGISGATYTAEAYVSSIQSALNKLHFK